MADLKYYDVILKPVITEASMAVLENKKYTVNRIEINALYKLER